MASSFSAARPKRDSEAFARAHHGQDRDRDRVGQGPAKKVKFDLRNPSTLAPSAHDPDADDDDDNNDLLEADVIGKGGRGTKRGAVNIDGYDSDSDNENFEDRAEARTKGKKGKKNPEDVDFFEAMDKYDPKKGPREEEEEEEEEEIDMFGDSDAEKEDTKKTTSGKKGKEVRFLADDEIEGQEMSSKSGGHIHLDDAEHTSSEDEDSVTGEIDYQKAMEEEGLDAEVGAGGLKKHAPKIDAFNMKAEQEEGAFDEEGNYIRKAADADAVHDRWLEGISKKDMKKAREAHEKREEELRRAQRESDSVLTKDLLSALIRHLEPGETVLDALARLRRAQMQGGGGKQVKKVPKWKQKKLNKGNSNGDGDVMEVDGAEQQQQQQQQQQDPKQRKIKEAINAIAEAADKLLGRDYPNIYETERERLMREYRAETGEDWVAPPAEEEEDGTSGNGGTPGAVKMWEFRWTDGRDGGQKQGPFDGPTMKAWQDAGYFKENVEFRLVGDEGGWTRVANFV